MHMSHFAGLLPIGRLGGPGPPKCDLFVAAFRQLCWRKAATKGIFLGPAAPAAPTGDLASSIMSGAKYECAKARRYSRQAAGGNCAEARSAHGQAHDRHCPGYSDVVA